jgi:hypothetical protein
MIPLFMTCFEALNLTIEACTYTSAHGDEFENESNIRLELPLRSLFGCLHITVTLYGCHNGSFSCIL